MRRASTCLAVLGLAVLGLPARSVGRNPPPKITSFKTKAVPIPKPGGGTYPHTGNILPSKGGPSEQRSKPNTPSQDPGTGATTQNPAGGIPPISGVNFFLPAGAKLHPAGFGTCTGEVLKNVGPERLSAPRRSRARSEACSAK